MSEKPKRKPSNLWKWLLAGTLVIFGLCALAFVAFAYWAADSWDIDAEFSGSEAKTNIEELIAAPLPESATEIHLYYLAWQDFFAYIRFDAPAEDILAWLEENDFCFKDLKENEQAYLFREAEELAWWRPNEASRYAVSEQCGENPYYELVIDQTNPDFWIVYLVIFST